MYTHKLYPKNDLNVYDIISINLKFILSTNSSTRTIYFILLLGGVEIYFHLSRAISTTRTVFRLNTNQGHAYEDYLN